MDVANHDNVFVCWNSNDSDRLEDGTIKKHVDLVLHKIHSVHMRDLYQKDYPFHELFTALLSVEYKGYCQAEIQGSSDPERVMRYYSALYREKVARCREKM